MLYVCDYRLLHNVMSSFLLLTMTLNQALNDNILDDTSVILRHHYNDIIPLCLTMIPQHLPLSRLDSDKPLGLFAGCSTLITCICVFFACYPTSRLRDQYWWRWRGAHYDHDAVLHPSAARPAGSGHLSAM